MTRKARLLPLAMVMFVAMSIAARGSSPTRLVTSCSLEGPSFAHWLGCGEGGVDLLAWVAHASLRGILLACAVALWGMGFGTWVGAGAALARGKVERAIERTCDLLQAFPSFLLALALLASVRRPGRLELAFVFGITAWTPFARLALAETRVLRDAVFVQAARALGARPSDLVFKHMVPQLVPVVAVQLGSTAAALLVSEAALSFLGFGPSDGVSLGALLDQGVGVMLRAPHVLAVGAIGIITCSSALLAAGTAFDARARP